MPHLSPEQLHSLRTQLITEKRHIEHRLAENEHYGLGDSMKLQTGELSPIDNHPGDLGTEVFERAKDISLLEHDEFQVERIASALQSMDEGRYGICVVCRQPISFERLQAVPYTQYCVDHQPDHVSSDRPVEEQFLEPPFGRTSLDEREDQNGFDGEDAWQIVESWGTSNTPAMAEGSDIDSYDVMSIEATDEVEGCVEAYESFVATDIYGQDVSIVRNRQYKEYLERREGEGLLEPDVEFSDEWY